MPGGSPFVWSLESRGWDEPVFWLLEGRGFDLIIAVLLFGMVCQFANWASRT